MAVQACAKPEQVQFLDLHPLLGGPSSGPLGLPGSSSGPRSLGYTCPLICLGQRLLLAPPILSHQWLMESHNVVPPSRSKVYYYLSFQKEFLTVATLFTFCFLKDYLRIRQTLSTRPCERQRIRQLRLIAGRSHENITVKL